MSGPFHEPSLAEFLSPESTAQHTTPIHADGRSPEWMNFEADLRAGLKAAKVQALDRIRSGKSPGLISVSGVLAKAGRGRTQFYEQHGQFQARIRLADAAAKRLWARLRRKSAAPGITELRKEVTRLRAEAKAMERRLASQKVGEFVELLLSKKARR